MGLCPVFVYISVDIDGASSTFRAGEVQTMLQSQLSANVFNNLVAGDSVKIIVREEAAGLGTLGWSGDPKHLYSTRVKWGSVPAGNWAQSGGDETVIDLNNIEATFAGLSRFEGPQFWVNVLAHESIWLNASGQSDHTQGMSFTPAPDGEISSGHVNGSTPFTVLQSSRSTILNAFGLKSN